MSALASTLPPQTQTWVQTRPNLPSLGAWAIHFILIFIGKILFDIIPGMNQETSWTLVNLSYTAGSYLMFHYVRGVPFDFNAGAYDNLNMWEQIDNGDQYTPAKKFLLFVPIALFLISTHYTRYDLTYFIVNCMATIAVVIPKLPSVPTPILSLSTPTQKLTLIQLHRLRISFFNSPPDSL